jgi:hypothetical protein
MVLRFRDALGADGPWRMAHPVRYVDDVPSFFDNDSLEDMLSGQYVMDHRHIMDTFSFTKSMQWAHERVWRIYAGAGRTRGPHEDIPFSAVELDGVIFG